MVETHPLLAVQDIYSSHSQLLFVSESHLFRPRRRNAPCCRDMAFHIEEYYSTIRNEWRVA
jgi:hypothetical protein